MSTIHFNCTFCGADLSAETDAKEPVIECGECGRVVNVPDASKSETESEDTSTVMRPRAVALQIKFLCPRCGKKLRCDVECEGHHVNCPGCQQKLEVPGWSRSLEPQGRLSEAEVGFLSSSDRTGAGIDPA